MAISPRRGAASTASFRPDTQTDLNQTRFSVAHDEARILPLLLRQALLNPGLKIMASPPTP